jgi:hypothetical protein
MRENVWRPLYEPCKTTVISTVGLRDKFGARLRGGVPPAHRVCPRWCVSYGSRAASGRVGESCVSLIG